MSSHCLLHRRFRCLLHAVRVSTAVEEYNSIGKGSGKESETPVYLTASQEEELAIAAVEAQAAAINAAAEAVEAGGEGFVTLRQGEVD